MLLVSVVFFRIPQGDSSYDNWENNAYKIFDPSIKDGTIDIPEDFRYLNLAKSVNMFSLYSV